MSTSSAWIRTAEIAAATGIVGPLLGWLAVALPFEPGTAAYDASLSAFVGLGLVGLGGFFVAVLALIYLPLVAKVTEGLGRAVILTVLVPVSWVLTWVVAMLLFATGLTEPGALDPFFGTLGGAH